MSKRIQSSTLIRLKKIVGEDCFSSSSSILLQHAKDMSFHNPTLPDVVLWPSSTKEVSAILSLANKEKIPVTTRGGGSSLEGNPIPRQGGIVIN